MLLGNPKGSTCLLGRALCRLTSVAVQEENFDEAMSNAHKLFSPPSIRAPRSYVSPIEICCCSRPQMLRTVLHKLQAVPGCLLVSHADEGAPAYSRAFYRGVRKFCGLQHLR